LCLRAGLDAVEKRKIPAGNWTQAVQLVARRYADWTIQQQELIYVNFEPLK
jgi:hypothetical protein